MPFDWNPDKAIQNVRKHGVSFEEAATVFTDPLSQMFFDHEHSDDESRYVTMGMSGRKRLLVVGHTERGKEIRIITARLATKKERKSYEEDWE